MNSQDVTATHQSHAAGGKLLHADVALDVTPHSTLVVENLPRFLAPGKTACGFLYAMPEPPTHDRTFSLMDEEAQQELVRIVNDQFDQYAKTLSDRQLVVEDRHILQHVETPEEGILQHVEQQTPDLLVLGMHSPTPSRAGWRLSSTSYAIATHAPCSVLVVKRPIASGTKLKVLFATDGSSQADKAAAELVRFLPPETTDVSILTVVSVNYYMMPLVEPYIDYAPLERAMQGDALTLLERTKTIFQRAGFTVSNAYFTLGDPVDQILDEADKNGIDLIAVGSHGAGGRLTQWLLGSVSSKVLEYSPASVAILR